ncbi:MAG TPA: YtxH domain-containing protein [Nitrospiraceae bacterium]|nr:YtxH domain-containing protein [Nitrospiraceae bacterium]
MEQLHKSEIQHSSGFLLGALVGAGVALLFAPQSGAEIRRLIRDYAVRAREELADNVERGTDALDSAVERGHEFVEKVHEVGRQGKTYAEVGTKVAQGIKDELTSQPR